MQEFFPCMSLALCIEGHTIKVELYNYDIKELKASINRLKYLSWSIAPILLSTFTQGFFFNDKYFHIVKEKL